MWDLLSQECRDEVLGIACTFIAHNGEETCPSVLKVGYFIH